MAHFLVTITAYNESATGPIHYQSLRERLADLGLRDYLISDIGEWVALPTNVFAAWVQGNDGDSILEEWRTKLGNLFGQHRERGAVFVTVGTDAVWRTQVFNDCGVSNQVITHPNRDTMMPVSIFAFGIDRLSFEERLALVQEIWDSLRTAEDRPPLSEGLRQELDRRLADHRANPDDVVP